MKTETEIKLPGPEALRGNPGSIDTKHFIALVQRERSDYT